MKRPNRNTRPRGYGGPGGIRAMERGAAQMFDDRAFDFAMRNPAELGPQYFPSGERGVTRKEARLLAEAQARILRRRAEPEDSTSEMVIAGKKPDPKRFNLLPTRTRAIPKKRPKRKK